jgi:hypothetical protein
MKQPVVFGQIRNLQNFTPVPYNRVAVHDFEAALTEANIRHYHLGKEVYWKTEFVVLKHHDRFAVIALQKAPQRNGFFQIVCDVEVVAFPDECHYLVAPSIDPLNRSQLASAARAAGVGHDQTLIVWGLFDHVNFLHRPNPLHLRVAEIVPPEPPKLYEVARMVMQYADLPPIVLDFVPIDLRTLAAAARTSSYLVPCRSGGLDSLPGKVYYLDQRPAHRADWTLLGCTMSLEFHRHIYGDTPPHIDFCPKSLHGDDPLPTLIKCSLVEQVEQRGSVVVVPWRSEQHQVVEALARASEDLVYS